MRPESSDDLIAVAAGYRDKRVLVTGASGHLATSLAARFRDIECTVLRLTRDTARLVPIQGRARIVDVAGDRRLSETWRRTLEGVDVVFHFAAQTSAYVAAADPLADIESNVLPMLHLLETCRGKGWRPTVLFSGTVTEAGIPLRWPVDESHADRPVTVYDLHKLAAETYLKCYAADGVVRGAVLRLANLYGPGSSSSQDRGVLAAMIWRALKGEALTIYGGGQYLRDYVYVEDVVQAFLLAGLHAEAVNGRYFVIGSGEGHTLAEAFNLVADRVARRTGCRVPVVHVEPPAGQAAIEARNFVADSSQFTRATGWRARWSLAEGIDATIEALA